MKYETETNDTKKPTVVVEKSALEEFLEEWGSWRGKKKAVKAERDSHIAQPRHKQRKLRNAAPNNDWIFLAIINGLAGLTRWLCEIVMFFLSFIFNTIGFFLKYILWIFIIGYFWLDVDFTSLITTLGEVDDTIQQIEEKAEGANERVNDKLNEIDTIKNSIADTLKAAREQLDGIRLTIEKDDGTIEEYDSGDLFSTEPTPPPLMPESEYIEETQ